MSQRTIGIALLLVCGLAGAQTRSFSLSQDARFIFGPSIGASLLHQCSRSAPAGIKEFWEPSAEQISVLEQKLLPYLAERAKTGASVPAQGVAYHRQYVGFVRGGVRLIYGNFYPGGPPSMNEARGPVTICDGGAYFWGIVFNPGTGQFEEPQFNGVA